MDRPSPRDLKRETCGRNEWRGQAINIAGDAMTGAETAAVFSSVLGQEVPYVQQPLEEYLASFPRLMRPLFRWYHEAGYTADVAGLRARYPDLLTLEQYLQASWMQP